MPSVRWPNREELAFFVSSSSRKDQEHLVRLDEPPWNEGGCCSCEHHELTVRPAVKKGILKHGAQAQCRHITAAKIWFAEEMVRLLQEAREAQGAVDPGVPASGPGPIPGRSRAQKPSLG